MSRPRDLQIFWVVVIALTFWAAVWQHEIVAKYWARTQSIVRSWLK
jgi:hypothetical protein